MSCHFVQNLLSDTKTFFVSRINNEENTIDIRVEEAPAFTIAALKQIKVFNSLPVLKGRTQDILLQSEEL